MKRKVYYIVSDRYRISLLGLRYDREISLIPCRRTPPSSPFPAMPSLLVSCRSWSSPCPFQSLFLFIPFRYFLAPSQHHAQGSEPLPVPFLPCPRSPVARGNHEKC